MLKHTLIVSESEQSRTKYGLMSSFFSIRMSRVMSMKRSFTIASNVLSPQLLTMYLKSMYAVSAAGTVDRQLE